jgi:hypothetical protein
MAEKTTVSGLALVDIPALGLKSGEYAEIDAELADAHTKNGEFDPLAPPPE